MARAQDTRIIVAVLDTGVDYEHIEFQNPDERDNRNIWANYLEINGDSGTDDDGNGYIDDIRGWDFAGDEALNPNDDDDDPMDFQFHGTHVAGIIGARTNNNAGIAGVNWSVQIMCVKIFADDSDDSDVALDPLYPTAFDSDAIDGIMYAVQNIVRSGVPGVINASWGGPYYSQALYDAIRYARDEGVLFVAAAGNAGYDNDVIFDTPSGYNLANIISVMATDHDDNVASVAYYSNYGRTSVDLAAPGGDGPGESGLIFSTFPTDETDAMAEAGYSEDYEYLGGTSMAAPYVSGAAALMLAANQSLSYSQIKTLILTTVDLLPSLDGLCVSEGRLNLFNAVNAAVNVVPDPGDVRVLNNTTKNTYSTIQDAILDASNGHDIIVDAYNWYLEDIDFGGKQIIVRSAVLGPGPPAGDYTPTNFTLRPDSTFICGVFAPHFPVTFSTGETITSELHGFTILGSFGIGVDCFNASSPLIGDCVIRSNMGGVSCDQGSDPTFLNCTIWRNTSTANGGGVYIHDSSPTFTNSQISRNTTSGVGGGFYLDNSSPVLTSCTVSENTAGSEGGGLYLNDSPMSFTGCTISENAAVSEGGGIRCDNSSLDITGCTITANVTGYGEGGGIYGDSGSPLTIDNCTISYNSSGYYDTLQFGGGGGIYCANSVTKITESEITANTAELDGGGIFIDGVSPTITDSRINGNISHWDGGGIYCYNSDANITDSTISGNICNYAGGGIYLYDSTPTINNLLITENLADGWDGGGIFFDGSSPAVTNCTFAGNWAAIEAVGGAICCEFLSEPVVVTNCIFSENRNIAIYEYGDEEDDPNSDVNVTYCMFHDNLDGDYYDFDTSMVYDVNTADGNDQDPCNLNLIPDGYASYNLDANPLFVTGRLGDYYLSWGEAGQIGPILNDDGEVGDANSPAVDAGIGTAAELGMDDPYSTRTDNDTDTGIVDIGYHYNDPLAPASYGLTTVVDPPGSGSVSPSSGSFTQHTQVKLVADAGEDHQFVSWTGTDDDERIAHDPNGVPLSTQYNIVTMSSNKTVTAMFETRSVQLRARVSGGSGSIDPRRGWYPRGSQVELTATPTNPGDMIIWSGTDDDFGSIPF